MAEHVNEWLSAYLDHELSGARLWQVEKHLAECAECQAELDEMRELSTLLHDAVPAGEFISTERFVANLTLNLPRQPEPTAPRKILEVGWWLIPVGVLTTWLFVQVTFSLSSLVINAANAGLLDGTVTWLLQGNPPQTEWFTLTMRFFGDDFGMTGKSILWVLNDADVFIDKLTGQFIWEFILASLYLGWLASWWFRQRKHSAATGSFSQS